MVFVNFILCNNNEHKPMPEEKIIKLAKKLKALAERGEGGEKINAAAMLRRLMAQYGITVVDIEGEEKHWREFYFRNKYEQRILYQCIYMVLSHREAPMYKPPRSHGVREMEVTDAEFIEINALQEFFYTAFLNELDLFLAAFIQKNHMFPENAKSLDTSELSIDEWERIMRIQEMAQGINRHTFRRSLGNGD